MNIANLYQNKKPVFSLEVFPPKKTTSIETIYNTLYDLRELPCDFISVTYGAGGSTTQRKKTLEIASLIKKEYHIEPVTHLTCLNSSKEEVAAVLDDLIANGIQNILALRGDKNPDVPIKSDFTYASDLAAFIRSYDDSFNVLGACYPECHFEASSLDEDIENLKKKIDSGVTSLTTQLFFDNETFYRFLEKVRGNGITVPIAAGIMPITKKSQIERTVSMCGASLPQKFSAMINQYSHDDAALKDAGIDYATDQIIDLIGSGVDGIHLYTMNNVEVATRISGSIKNIIKSSNANR